MTMHPTILHEMARSRQQELQAQAGQAGLVRLARASHSGGRSRSGGGSRLRTVVAATALLLGLLAGSLVV